MFLDWRILKQCRVDVLPGKIVDYLWDLVRKAAPAPPRKVTSDAMRHRGGPRPMTHLHRARATATMSRGEICLVIILNISMGGMWHGAHDTCHACHASRIVSDSHVQCHPDKWRMRHSSIHKQKSLTSQTRTFLFSSQSVKIVCRM